MAIISSCIKPLGGVPTLFVEDKPITPTAYITYLTEKTAMMISPKQA